MVVFAQLGQLIISIPFALFRVLTTPAGNPVGIEANIAYYGFGLIIFSLFNLVFFIQFYKTAYKVGRAFIIAGIPMVIGIVIMELLSHIPSLQWLDSINPDMMIRQIPILAFGIVIYVVGMIFTYHVAAKRFERVDI